MYTTTWTTPVTARVSQGFIFQIIDVERKLKFSIGR